MSMGGLRCPWSESPISTMEELYHLSSPQLQQRRGYWLGSEIGQVKYEQEQ